MGVGLREEAQRRLVWGMVAALPPRGIYDSQECEE